MSIEQAREHAAQAERLLAQVDLTQVGRRQGFDPKHAHTATVAAAFATLALAELALAKVGR